MTELYKNLGQSANETLEAGGGKQIAVSLEPGHGTVKHGTVLYRKSSGLYAPAAAGNITENDNLVVLVTDTDTDTSLTVAEAAAAYISGELLAKDVVLSDGETNLTAAQALILRKQGIVLYPFDDLKAADVVYDNTVIGIETDVPAGNTDLLGKTADELQADIAINGDEITGTLKFIADYSSAGYTGDEQSGNFLALHFASNKDGAVIKVELVNGIHGEQTLDEDGLAIFRVSNKATQKVKVTATAGGESIVKTYGLSGLTLNNA